MSEKKECYEPQTWLCPICEVPLMVGERCEDGTLIESVALKELPEYFHNFNWEMFSLHLLEVFPEFEDMEEQRAIFFVIPPVERQKKDAWVNLFVPEGIERNKEIIEWAIYNLIEEYKYRKDCGLIEELKEKYGEEIRSWKNTRINLTANQRRYISDAARYWGLDMRTTVSLFLAWILNDEMFRPSAGED